MMLFKKLFARFLRLIAQRLDGPILVTVKVDGKKLAKEITQEMVQEEYRQMAAMRAARQ